MNNSSGRWGRQVLAIFHSIVIQRQCRCEVGLGFWGWGSYKVQRAKLIVEDCCLLSEMQPWKDALLAVFRSVASRIISTK